jgi:hypothetical protein
LLIYQHYILIALVSGLGCFIVYSEKTKAFRYPQLSVVKMAYNIYSPWLLGQEIILDTKLTWQEKSKRIWTAIYESAIGQIRTYARFWRYYRWDSGVKSDKLYDPELVLLTLDDNDTYDNDTTKMCVLLCYYPGRSRIFFPCLLGRHHLWAFLGQASDPL